MKNTKNDVFDEVKGIFTNYLKKHNYRKTQGRYDILFEIYTIDDHFEVEDTDEGIIRVSIVHYNSEDDVSQLVSAIGDL